MRVFRGREGQRGLTLVETLAALTVFSIITLGVVPLLASSIRGAALSRTFTVGKGVAVQAMERSRGLPYFTSYNAQPRPVDLLDLYFPRSNGTTTYTTTCPAAGGPACAFPIPDDYTVRFDASFVTPDSTTTPESYDPIQPPAGYAWNSATADSPPSQLLDLTITVSWETRGQDRSFELRSIIGDRKSRTDLPTGPSPTPSPIVSPVRGNATIDYVVQVVTGFQRGTEITELTARAGSSDSRMETTPAYSNATSLVRTGELRLVRVDTAGGVGQDLALLTGAIGSLTAPPDTTSPVTVSKGSQTLRHNFITPSKDVAAIDTSIAENMTAGVANSLPFATGGFRVRDTGTPGLEFWVDNQADRTTLQIDPSASTRVLFVQRTGSTADRIVGSTSTTTGPLAGARGVFSTATASVNGIQLFPTTFIPNKGAAIELTNFTATVTCNSTLSSASTVASVTWSASLRYWAEASNDDRTGGTYRTVTLGSAVGSDPLQAVKAANPLVYDGRGVARDIYLFEDGTKRGYLKDWSSVPSGDVFTSPDNRVTYADLGGAIRIDTSRTNATVADSDISLSIGRLSCNSEDMR